MPRCRQHAETFANVDESDSTFRVEYPESEEQLLERTQKAAAAISDRYYPEHVLLVSHAPVNLGTCGPTCPSTARHVTTTVGVGLSLALSSQSPQDHDIAPWPLGGLSKFTRSTKETGAFVWGLGHARGAKCLIGAVAGWTRELNGSTAHLSGEEAKAGMQRWTLPCLTKSG